MTYGPRLAFQLQTIRPCPLHFQTHLVAPRQLLLDLLHHSFLLLPLPRRTCGARMLLLVLASHARYPLFYLLLHPFLPSPTLPIVLG